MSRKKRRRGIYKTSSFELSGVIFAFCLMTPIATYNIGLGFDIGSNNVSKRVPKNIYISLSLIFWIFEAEINWSGLSKGKKIAGVI